MADWVDKLLADQQLARRTIAQYATCVRYWNTWHQLRVGTPLPLAELPPRAVSADVLTAFIDDHLAIAVEGHLKMRMADSVFDGLREAGYNARIECVTPAATDWRLGVLRKAHGLLNLNFDRDLVRSRKPEFYAAWAAERAALGVPLEPPMSATNTVNALVGACSDDREGIMAAALIIFLCVLTPRQAAALRFNELLPGTVVQDGNELDAVEFTIRDPVNELQTFQPKVRFVGNEAAIIKAWGAIREDEIQGDDWFFVRKMRRNSPPSIDHAWIACRIRKLAQLAGLADASGRTRISPQWLRKTRERELREHSLLIKVARAARVSTHSAMLLTRRLRE